ncbi:MAG TPA: hypothetical protein VEN79_07525, partial [Terriglobia bacterium]|nr:hypothetical protein [Terriglobia bacterium]
ALPNNQLVFVRSGPRAMSEYDWVYNSSDIDRAKVVWARDMGAAANQELIDYYKDRQVWWVDPDKDSGKWGPYAAQADLKLPITKVGPSAPPAGGSAVGITGER